MSWLVFDLDDTLIRTSEVYQRAYQKYGNYMETTHHFNANNAIQLMLDIDLENRKIMDVRKERIPISMYQAYETLTYREGGKPNLKLQQEFEMLMEEEVFKHQYKFVWGAKKVLDECRSRGFRTILYTRGDYEIQERKINSLNLTYYFDHIFIKEKKGVEQLLEIVNSVQLEPEEAWMIGDEITADVEPALQIGMGAMYVWGYRQSKPETLKENERLISVQRLTHILPYLKKSSFVY